MRIKNKISSKVKKDYFFVEGFVDTDVKYFIKQIEKGIGESNNSNFKTNVIAPMTSHKYFNQDKKFIQTILPLLDFIDRNLVSYAYYLDSSWGYKEGFSHYTKMHNHVPASISGVIYLNDHHQTLDFPEIKQEIKPAKGKFILFSPFLEHGCKRNVTDKFKYGLAFNWHPVEKAAFDKL
jgi:hypothetical protein|tara:strand:- start:2391 stop:2927 length:537 start_codon:yes stop_codon:yes gene_type:complete